MLDIDNEISLRYGFDIKNILPYKDSQVVNTSRGKFVLKKSTFSQERINFVHAAKEHLYNNGFKGIDRYLCTAANEPYFEADGYIYTVNEFVEGVECNFDNRADVIKSSRILAAMHKSSKGFISPELSMARNELGKLPIYFNRRLEEIKKLKKAATKGKTSFDYLFLKHVDYFYNLGSSAIDSLSKSKYNELVETCKKEGLFCHHDFTHRNVINNEGKISVINFEYCCYELKIYDLANFIRRKMRKCKWNISEAKVIVNEYCSVENLSNDEFEVLGIILQFPQKFWRVVNKYYNSKRSWSERSYVDKLQDVIDEVIYHKQFMDKFDTLVK